MLNNLVDSQYNLGALYHRQINVFKSITKPTEDILRIKCYLLVFKNSRYYMITDNKDFIEEFGREVKRGYIFCSRNITRLEDHRINFTLWPDVPTDLMSRIFYKFDYWNGVTASKISKNYAELWWFCSNRNNIRAQEFIASNKTLLVRLMNCFSRVLNQINIPRESAMCPYAFSQGFDISTVDPLKKHIELEVIKRYILIPNEK